jgi:hypothetical protein
VLMATVLQHAKPTVCETTVSHKLSLTAARHAIMAVAVPSTIYYPANYKIKIYYLRWNLKV